LLSITPSTLGFYIVSELFFAQYYSFNFRILHCIWVVLCSVLLLQLHDSTLYLGCSLLSITPSTLGFYIVSELFFAQYYSFNFVILHCIWVVLCSVLLFHLMNSTLHPIGFPQPWHSALWPSCLTFFYYFNFNIVHYIQVVYVHLSLLILQLYNLSRMRHRNVNVIYYNLLND
jgi:hypothetical protein